MITQDSISDVIGDTNKYSHSSAKRKQTKTTKKNHDESDMVPLGWNK